MTDAVSFSHPTLLGRFLVRGPEFALRCTGEARHKVEAVSKPDCEQ